MKNKNTNVKLYADVTNKLPIIKVFYHFIMNASNEIENYEWTGLYLFNNKHWGVSSSRALPISHATQVEIIPRWGHSEWFDTWADATQLKNKNDVAHSALLQTNPPPRLSLSPTTFICRPELLILTLFGPSLTPTPKTWRGSRWAEVANRTPSESRGCLLVGWCLRGVPRIHMWQQRTMRRAADALPAPGRSWELRADWEQPATRHRYYHHRSGALFALANAKWQLPNARLIGGPLSQNQTGVCVWRKKLAIPCGTVTEKGLQKQHKQQINIWNSLAAFRWQHLMVII